MKKKCFKPGWESEGVKDGENGGNGINNVTKRSHAVEDVNQEN